MRRAGKSTVNLMLGLTVFLGSAVVLGHVFMPQVLSGVHELVNYIEYRYFPSQ